MMENLTAFGSRRCACGFQPRSTSRASASGLTRPQKTIDFPATPALILRMSVNSPLVRNIDHATGTTADGAGSTRQRVKTPINSQS